jgi:hypothetical protein
MQLKIVFTRNYFKTAKADLNLSMWVTERDRFKVRCSSNRLDEHLIGRQQIFVLQYRLDTTCSDETRIRFKKKLGIFVQNVEHYERGEHTRVQSRCCQRTAYHQDHHVQSSRMKRLSVLGENNS